jgi:hypothetical protein
MEHRRDVLRAKPAYISEKVGQERMDTVHDCDGIRGLPVIRVVCHLQKGGALRDVRQPLFTVGYPDYLPTLWMCIRITNGLQFLEDLHLMTAAVQRAIPKSHAKKNVEFG